LVYLAKEYLCDNQQSTNQLIKRQQNTFKIFYISAKILSCYTGKMRFHSSINSENLFEAKRFNSYSFSLFRSIDSTTATTTSRFYVRPNFGILLRLFDWLVLRFFNRGRSLWFVSVF